MSVEFIDASDCSGARLPSAAMGLDRHFVGEADTLLVDEEFEERLAGTTLPSGLAATEAGELIPEEMSNLSGADVPTVEE
jgi:hypothetical protein